MPFRTLEHSFWPIFSMPIKKSARFFRFSEFRFSGSGLLFTIVYDCLRRFSRFMPIEMFARQVSMPIKIFARSADFVEFLCLDARFA